jgi:pterin-4a-carbinolamine dehydratase
MRLLIDLNTHDIKDISEKDYLLAFISEQILFEDTEKTLLDKWNAL